MEGHHDAEHPAEDHEVAFVVGGGGRVGHVQEDEAAAACARGTDGLRRQRRLRDRMD